MASIRLEKLVKNYGDNVVVHGLDLEIFDNEFVVLVGPSGCGKTTTLRMVAGLEEITSGEVYIGEKCVTNAHPKDRDIAMVFQSYALYPHKSVYENMALGLRNRKVPSDDIDRRIKEAAGFLGIDRYLQRKPRALSGGQRQRVALGRAIVREPQVFLMDEPLSNLDAQIRAQTRIEILRIHQRVRSTVMYVTHDQVEAMTMGDRIVVMKDGLVQQVAAPKQIYDHPANRFVASFIGSPPMNFFDAELSRNGDSFAIRNADFSFDVDGAVFRALADVPSRDVTIGIRPEDVRLESGGPIASRVEVVETLGAEQHVVLSVGKTSILARVGAEEAVVKDEARALRFNLSKLHVFDRETGKAYA